MEAGKKPKILVVDDEPIIVELIKVVLEYSGYAVSTALNGPEALKQLKASAFDLVLCDIAMPGQTGFEVFKEAQEFQNGIKFIFVSAFNNQENINKCMGMGAKAFLGKPFNNDDLVDVVERTLKN